MKFSRQTTGAELHSVRPAGFTLIEMMISVSLVLLMMVMFAEIFSLASSAMTSQQAIADNGQQVRSVSIVLAADLDKRTMRTLVPFFPGESIDLETISFSERDGYMYISLNDPNNAVDNVLQFTVRSTIKLKSGDDSPYFGRATGLVSLNPAVAGATQAAQHVRSNPQQPEHDDGELELNSTGASPAAEICYFVRGGRLYRRVTLLREPLPVSGGSRTQPRMSWDNVTRTRVPEPFEYFRRNINPARPTMQLQTNPATGEYGRYDPVTGVSLSNDYWNDFDYSALQSIYIDPMGTAIPDGAELLLARDLDNSVDGALSLGNPRRRFGFDQFTGISREFSHADPSAAGFFFLGRYTLEEMSSPGFNFPQADSVLGPNPLSYASVPALADALPAAEPDGVVDAFAGGPRRGTDLLLSNVHAFDIEVWDDRVRDFVPIGHSRSGPGADNVLGTADDEPGDYHRSRYQTTTSGRVVVPGDESAWITNAPDWMGRVFDTWHPDYDHDGDSEDVNGNGVLDMGEDTNGNGVLDLNRDRSPYRALQLYPPTSPVGPYANRGRWQASGGSSGPVRYAVGDIVFPLHKHPLDDSFVYQCIKAGTAGTGSEDLNGNGILDPGEDVNGNMTLDDAEPFWPTTHLQELHPPPTSPRPHWRALRNVRPLRAIRLRIRFLHVASGKMRQLTLVHSLIDNPRE